TDCSRTIQRRQGGLSKLHHCDKPLSSKENIELSTDLDQAYISNNLQEEDKELLLISTESGHEVRNRPGRVSKATAGRHRRRRASPDPACAFQCAGSCRRQHPVFNSH